jgi:uncharacterized cupredoxin-like copper-binding protein
VRISRRVTGPACLLAASVALYGCGSGSGADQPSGPTARVKERDFKISAPATLPAGEVDLSVDNRGPDDHELIVARVSNRLPRRSDGLTIDEKAIDPQTVGTLEPGIGERQLQVNLRPGRYVMFCNMQGHYLGGMVRTFRVG